MKIVAIPFGAGDLSVECLAFSKSKGIPAKNRFKQEVYDGNCNRSIFFT
jgi:hypothetical protein